MSRFSVQDLAARLDALPPGANGRAVDVDRVSELVAEAGLDHDSLRSYVGARDDKYARRLVHRSDRFDVMVLTWMPGQCTPVHNHAGHCGWVRLVQGRIREDSFALAPSARASGVDVAPELPKGIGCVELVPTGSVVVADAGAVAAVDRVRAIHRIGNPREHAGDEVAVTLHVYSRPHDVCLVFDPEQRTCGRREMRFDPPPA
ncbi:MAG: cysteine dioxygenase family protein [Planctomycetota bacterium]